MGDDETLAARVTQGRKEAEAPIAVCILALRLDAQSFCNLGHMSSRTRKRTSVGQRAVDIRPMTSCIRCELATGKRPFDPDDSRSVFKLLWGICSQLRDPPETVAFLSPERTSGYLSCRLALGTGVEPCWASSGPFPMACGGAHQNRLPGSSESFAASFRSCSPFFASRRVQIDTQPYPDVFAGRSLRRQREGPWPFQKSNCAPTSFDDRRLTTALQWAGTTEFPGPVPGTAREDRLRVQGKRIGS
jgi:hypothetical protein